MKKIVIVITIMMLSFTSKAQFGARVGLDFAKLNVEVSDDYESISDAESYLGVYVGIFGNLYIVDNFSFRPELNYYHFSKEESSNLVDHIQIPLLLDVNFANTVDLMFGPSASFLFGVGDGGRSLNLSGNLGLAVKIKNYQVEARYVKGFANLSKNIDSSYDAMMNLNAFHIGVGYTLD